MDNFGVLALLGATLSAISFIAGYKYGYTNGDHSGSRRGFARGIQVSRNIVSEVNRAA
jgi:hypothetical protein